MSRIDDYLANIIYEKKKIGEIIDDRSLNQIPKDAYCELYKELAEIEFVLHRYKSGLDEMHPDTAIHLYHIGSKYFHLSDGVMTSFKSDTGINFTLGNVVALLDSGKSVIIRPATAEELVQADVKLSEIRNTIKY